MADEKEILNQAKQLILDKKYDEARHLLTSIKDNATAQKWLVKLDEIAPVKLATPPIPALNPIQTIEPPVVEPIIKKVEPRPDIQPMSNFDPPPVEELRPRKQKRELGLAAETPEDKTRFEQAKELFGQAQTILRQMSGNRRAAKWISRLDNIDKPYPGERFFDAGDDANPQQRIMHFINESKSSQTRSDLQEFVTGNVFRYLMGGTAVLMAIPIFLGFFLFSWVDFGVEEITPMQVWLATNDTYPTLDASDLFGSVFSEESDAGFGDVRLIDRLLILILPLAIGLGVVGVLYIQKRLPTKSALIALVALSFFLLIFGFFWRTLSTANWRGGIKDESNYDDLSDSDKERFDERLDEQIKAFNAAYSTGEHELYAFLAFTITGLGLVLLIADERGMLEPDYS